MLLEDYNAFCGSLAHTPHVVQWGDTHVWKIGGKVFAIASQSANASLPVSFKCSPMSFEVLKSQNGLRPAPYLASRGMPWIQRTSGASMDDDALRAYLRESYRLASLNLTKTIQRQLHLNGF